GSNAQTGTFTAPDWFATAQTAPNVAYFASGRCSPANGAFDTQASTATNPALYQIDITLANTNSQISSIGLSRSTGNGHARVFAVSGSVGGGVFSPIAISGYNQDVILEVPIQIALKAQQYYNLEMDYFPSGTTPLAQLYWSSTSTPTAIIPQSQLYPVTNPPPG